MVAEIKIAIKKITPDFFVNAYHFALVFLGAMFYGFPSRKIKVIGVTGTNGKSTVVEMVGAIFKEAGYRVASSSSIKFEVADKIKPNFLKMTMPGRFAIQRFLKQAADAGCHYVILEVTSEGIKQHRHRFIDFKAAVLTNVTPEHIEAHKGFENYRRTKERLFEAAKAVHIINIEDENAKYFLAYRAEKKICYSLKNSSTNSKEKKCETLKTTDVIISHNSSSFRVNETTFNINLLGEFNIDNAMAAISTAKAFGINLETCKKALEKIKGIPGRMEKVLDEPRVFVDYAFTPNALEKVYGTLEKNFGSEGIKMICVLGACGGGRDRWKRPVLGKIAAKHCDRIILTNEDPYDEDPNKIVSEIKKGIIESNYPAADLEIEMDRKEAIKKSLTGAKNQDIVILTGKGCEPWICLERGKKIPWDEKKTVLEEFNKLKGD